MMLASDRIIKAVNGFVVCRAVWSNLADPLGYPAQAPQMRRLRIARRIEMFAAVRVIVAVHFIASVGVDDFYRVLQSAGAAIRAVYARYIHGHRISRVKLPLGLKVNRSHVAIAVCIVYGNVIGWHLYGRGCSVAVYRQGDLYRRGRIFGGIVTERPKAAHKIHRHGLRRPHGQIRDFLRVIIPINLQRPVLYLWRLSGLILKNSVPMSISVNMSSAAVTGRSLKKDSGPVSTGPPFRLSPDDFVGVEFAPKIK